MGPMVAPVFAQAAAALAVMLRTRSARRKIAAPAVFSGFLAGVTEPADPGVNLPLKRPFWFGIIGGIIGGAFAGRRRGRLHGLRLLLRAVPPGLHQYRQFLHDAYRPGARRHRGFRADLPYSHEALTAAPGEKEDLEPAPGPPGRSDEGVSDQEPEATTDARSEAHAGREETDGILAPVSGQPDRPGLGRRQGLRLRRARQGIRHRLPRTARARACPGLGKPVHRPVQWARLRHRHRRRRRAPRPHRHRHGAARRSRLPCCREPR